MRDCGQLMLDIRKFGIGTHSVFRALFVNLDSKGKDYFLNPFAHRFGFRYKKMPGI